MSKLTPEAEARLIEDFQAGHRGALDRLIKASRSSIRAAVNGAASFELVDVEDLMQVGTLALIEAARRWTPEYRLWELARRPVTQAAYAEVARIAGVSERTLQRIGYAVRASHGDMQEARAFACSPERGTQRVTEETFDAIQDALSDTTPEEDATLTSGPEPGVTDETADLMDAVSAAAHVLDDRERTVLELHYGLRGEPMTDGAIAEEFGVDRSRIVRVRNRALRKLREEITSRGVDA